MSAPLRPAAPSGSFWARKYGPLPAWAWAGLGLGGALAYSVWTRNKAAGAAAATPADQSAPGDQSAPFVFVVPGQNSLGAPIPTPGAPTPPATPPASGRPAGPSYVEAVKRGKVGTVGTTVPVRAYIAQLSQGSGADKDAIQSLLVTTINDPRNSKYRAQAAAKGVWPGGADVFIHYATRKQ